jgi:hypothetical protein
VRAPENFCESRLAPAAFNCKVSSFLKNREGQTPLIGYVTSGTNDLKKAAAFYDKLCAEMGMERFMENDRLIAWGGPGGGAGFGIALPYDGKPMTVGNGAMAAFEAKTKPMSIASTNWRCRWAALAKALPARAATADFTPAISATPTATSSMRS